VSFIKAKGLDTENMEKGWRFRREADPTLLRGKSRGGR
jgi:hypothetical protein